MLCEGIPGNPMPVDGGVYAQHPVLMDRWLEIMSIKGKHEKREQEKSKRTRSRR